MKQKLYCCPFCQRYLPPKEIADSHIIPKYFFTSLPTQLVAVNSLGGIGTVNKSQVFQDDKHFTPLLCHTCDNKIGVWEGALKSALYGDTQNPLVIRHSDKFTRQFFDSRILGVRELEVPYRECRLALLALNAKLASASSVLPWYFNFRRFAAIDRFWAILRRAERSKLPPADGFGWILLQLGTHGSDFTSFAESPSLNQAEPLFSFIAGGFKWVGEPIQIPKIYSPRHWKELRKLTLRPNGKWQITVINALDGLHGSNRKQILSAPDVLMKLPRLRRREK